MTKLGRLEAAVMDALWSGDRPMTVRDVLENVHSDSSPAYTTVMTVLGRLHRKGMVLREKTGRAYVYRPTRSRATHTAELMEQILAGTTDRGTALLRFVEKMPEGELDALRRAVARVGTGPEVTKRSSKRIP